MCRPSTTCTRVPRPADMRQPGLHQTLCVLLHLQRTHACAPACAHSLRARAQALDSLACRRRVLLSGTPMQNHLDEVHLQRALKLPCSATCCQPPLSTLLEASVQASSACDKHVWCQREPEPRPRAILRGVSCAVLCDGVLHQPRRAGHAEPVPAPLRGAHPGRPRA